MRLVIVLVDPNDITTAYWILWVFRDDHEKQHRGVRSDYGRLGIKDCFPTLFRLCFPYWTSGYSFLFLFGLPDRRTGLNRPCRIHG
jgi:hypothetical protein